MSRHEDTITSVMPLLGAAGGALALEVLSQRVTMKKEALAAVSAGLAFIAATNTTGPARQLAMGAAAAAACYGLVEILRQKRPTQIYGEPPPLRQAAPSDGISREEFQKAIADMTVRRQEEIASIKKAYSDQIAQMHSTSENKIAEMHSAIQSLLRQLRDAKARLSARNVGPRRVLRDGPSTVASTAIVKAADANMQTAAERLAVVYSLLTDGEATHLQEIMTGLPPDSLATTEGHLLALSPDDAVAYLRGAVLARDAA